MIKRTFIAMMIVNEIVDESTGEKWPVLKPHTHPVFTGAVAYDLGDEQEIQIDDELNVREFVNEGEVIAAINDYYRECPKDEFEEVGAFYLLNQITASNSTSAGRISKKVSNKKIK